MVVVNIRKDVEALKRDLDNPVKLEESVNRTQHIAETTVRKKKLLEEVAQTEQEITRAKAEDKGPSIPTYRLDHS